MSNYYFDTEFHEYFKQPKLFGISVGKPIPTIDLISIGIVCEDGREYYAINKEFNLKDAWNNYQLEINKQFPQGPGYNKVYWIRENVLKNLFVGTKVYASEKRMYKLVKDFIKNNGKTRKQIAEEIIEFCEPKVTIDENAPNQIWAGGQLKVRKEPVFYAYYADYDWVVFCQSLFGRMMDLPDGFPWYCIDLKQILDEKILLLKKPPKGCSTTHTLEKWSVWSFDEKLKWIKKFDDEYPKQENEHNALDDAKWNKALHKFINNL